MRNELGRLLTDDVVPASEAAQVLSQAIDQRIDSIARRRDALSDFSSIVVTPFALAALTLSGGALAYLGYRSPTATAVASGVVIVFLFVALAVFIVLTVWRWRLRRDVSRLGSMVRMLEAGRRTLNGVPDR